MKGANVMGNKLIEQRCFVKAFSNIEKRDKGTRRVLYELNGENFFEDDQEQPDFIILHKSKDKTKQDTIVGIEHFEISHNSIENKKGKIVASDNIAKNNTHVFFNKYYSPEGPKITEEFLEDMATLIKNNFDITIKSRYENFLSSFEYSYKKHKEKVSEYYNRLNKIAGKEYKKEICFMFDIRYHFADFCRFDGKSIYIEDNFIPIIFSEMIEIIEKNNDSRITYIIFVISNDKNDSEYGVCAFRNKNIRSQLGKSNVKIYDFIIPEMECDADFKMKQNEENYVLIQTPNVKAGKYVKDIQASMREAEKDVAQNKPFVTDKCFVEYAYNNKKINLIQRIKK